MADLKQMLPSVGSAEALLQRRIARFSARFVRCVTRATRNACQEMCDGAGYPNRTDDLPLTRRVLYQLS